MPNKESKTLSREQRRQIGRRIASLREERDESQADLGRVIGVTASAVDRWEQGHTAPRWTNALKIAVHYGVNVQWIYEGNYVPRTPPAGDIADAEWLAFIREAEADGRTPDDLRRAWALYRDAQRHLHGK